MLVRERLERARENGDLELVAMLEIAIRQGVVSEDDRWDVDEETVFNWWESFKDELKAQGKELRLFYGERTWAITSTNK